MTKPRKHRDPTRLTANQANPTQGLSLPKDTITARVGLRNWGPFCSDEQTRQQVGARMRVHGASWDEVAQVLGYASACSARVCLEKQKGWPETLGTHRARMMRELEGRFLSNIENLAFTAEEERERVKATAEGLKHISRVDGLHARSGLGGDAGVSITIHVDASGAGQQVIEIGRSAGPGALETPILSGQPSAGALVSGGQDDPSA